VGINVSKIGLFDDILAKIEQEKCSGKWRHERAEPLPIPVKTARWALLAAQSYHCTFQRFEKGDS
jgi:hypothetical protein